QLQGGAILQIWIFSLDGQTLESTEEKGHGAPAVGEDPTNTWKPGGSPAENQAGDRTRRVGGVLNRRHGNSGNKSHTAFRLSGMHVNNRLSAVQFFVYGCEGFIAEVFVFEARHQTNTVSL